MTALVVVPSDFEHEPLVHAIRDRGHEPVSGRVGRLDTVEFPALDLTTALGGFGKTQLGIQTQHLIQSRASSPWECIVVAGAAGALIRDVRLGDIVIGSKTIEYDMRFSSGKPAPEFNSDPMLVESLVSQRSNDAFRLHVAPIASGDQDVIDAKTRAEVYVATQAAAVAWEGAGGARATAFNEIPFVEVRGISDDAESVLADEFVANTAAAMQNIASLLVIWRQSGALA